MVKPSSKKPPAPGKKLRIAVYLRISADPDGTQTATERQLKDCRAFAKLRGWNVAAVYEDKGISASKKVIRPQYEAMLEALEAGELDGVLVWRLDRLVRRTVEFSRFWEICKAADGFLASATQPVDTSDPVGMLIVHILVAFAEMEAETMGLRLRRFEEELAEKGLHKWMSQPAYGVRAGWQKLEPKEAAVIREAAERVLAGESLRHICIDFNRRDIPAPKGGDWRAISLRALLLQTRLWGYRSHNGVRSEVRGPWKAVLDETTGRELQEVLTRTGRKQNKNKDTTRSKLLSGLLRCETCGMGLRAGRISKTTGSQRYQCPTPPEGCGNTSIRMQPSDEAIRDMVLHRLDSPAVRRALSKRETKTDEANVLVELTRTEQRLKRLGEMWADDDNAEVDDAAFLAARKELTAKLDELRGQLAVSHQSRPLSAVLAAGDGLRAAWDELDVGRQRAVLEVLLDKVVVRRSDSPVVIERRRLDLAERERELLEEVARLRAAGGPADEITKALRKANWCKHAQLRDGGGGGTFRVERLEPVWKI